MKSVLYCGCTVNAYMPVSRREHSLSLLARTSLFRRGRSLSLSDSSCTTSLFARYLARWPPAQPMKARGGELLRRSYGMAGVAEGWGCCLRNVLIVSATPATHFQPLRPLASTPPATTPGAQPSSVPSPSPVHRPADGTIPPPGLLPPRPPPPPPPPDSPFRLYRARERAPDRLLRHCA